MRKATFTHTHTHTQREREREREGECGCEREKGGVWWLDIGKKCELKELTSFWNPLLHNGVKRNQNSTNIYTPCERQCIGHIMLSNITHNIYESGNMFILCTYFHIYIKDGVFAFTYQFTSNQIAVKCLLNCILKQSWTSTI